MGPELELHNSTLRERLIHEARRNRELYSGDNMYSKGITESGGSIAAVLDNYNQLIAALEALPVDASDEEVSAVNNEYEERSKQL